MKRTSTTGTRATSKLPGDDAPRLTQKHFERAHYRIGKRNVTRAEWQAAVRARVGKQRISIMLDAPIIEHFKSVAGERGYQTLINDQLRRVIEGEQFIANMRAAIREEIRASRKTR